ncbi:MAG: hypothetical protein ABWZ98_01440 [Nakamurella sp.]
MDIGRTRAGQGKGATLMGGGKYFGLAGRACLIGGLCCLFTIAQLGITVPAAGASAQQTPGDAEVKLAWSWVRSMLGTPTRVESTSTLLPAQEYPVDWVGRVHGTFLIDGVPTPPVVPAAVALEPESAIRAEAPSFRGVVSGHIAVRPEQDRWIVQAYRRVDGVSSPVPVQALVRSDGTFDLDVSTIEPGPGSWQFGLLDAFDGYAPVGVGWPSAGTYQGWEVRTFATTDRRYLVASQPASADGSFDFENSAPGTKTFQLVVTSPSGSPGAEKVLAEAAPVTGLLRSTADPADLETSTSHTYDQALAVQTALVMADLPTAKLLMRGLLALQTRSGPQAGGFISAAAQANPAAGEPVYRTGNTAVALYSMISYLQRIRDAGQEATVIRSAANRAADWLLRQQVTSGAMTGLLTGGWGEIGANGVLDPQTRLSFASTEHNLDAWHALSRAGSVLACARCTAAAHSLRMAILNILWDPSRNGFTQGMRPEGRDTVDPLDVNSWGSIFLDAIHQPGLAGRSLNRTTAFTVSDKSTTGYLAFRAQPAIPNPVSTVWFEGSFGVALAQSRHHDVAGYRTTMEGLRFAQRPDGSFPMATSPDVDLELSTASAVAATAWFILASRPSHPDSLWAAG